MLRGCRVVSQVSDIVDYSLNCDPIRLVLQVANALRSFVFTASMGVPRESQLRAAAVLRHVVDQRGDIFHYARELMLSRWRRRLLRGRFP